MLNTNATPRHTAIDAQPTSATPAAAPRWFRLAACLAACAFGATAATAAANPTLQLTQLPVGGVTIAVQLRNLGPTPVAGWEAFLEFDTTKLTFVSGAYVTNVFGLPILNPVVSNGNQINLAAGINQALGQPPTVADQDVAYLIFQSTGTGCQPHVRVRINNPPTRLSDAQGNAIGPITTTGPWSTCPADINHNGSVSVQDIFDFLAYWFAHDCRADFNNVNGVTVQDIFDFLAAWFSQEGPCP